MAADLGLFPSRKAPSDIAGGHYTFIDLFAGIGGFRIAASNEGGECVFSSEWDRYAQRMYLYNF